MNASVPVVYYKSKTLNNGEHPLMLRITKDRKSKYQSLGISIPLQYWDLSKNQPKRNCPDRDAILRLITEKMEQYHIVFFLVNSLPTMFYSYFLKRIVREFLNMKPITLP